MIDPILIVLILLLAAALSLVGIKARRAGTLITVFGTGFGFVAVLLNILSPFAGPSMFASYGLVLEVNGFTSLIAFVASFIGFLVAVYSFGYIEERAGIYSFFTSMTVACLIGMAYCWNLLWIFLFAEFCTFCSAHLIAHKNDGQALEGAIKYIIIQIATSFFAVVGLAIIYTQVGGGGFNAFNLTTLTLPGAITGYDGKLAILLIFISFAVKLPSFPLHAWLPDASTVAPAPISTLLHAMMIKVAGIPAFLVLFLFNALFTNVFIWIIVCILGAITMLYNVIVAFAQNDLKRLLAFDSVSQMGYVILGLGVGGLGSSMYSLTSDFYWLSVAGLGLVAGLFHLLNHSLFKSLLFFGAGAVEHETGVRDINQLGGLLQAMPRTGYLMLIGSLSIAGIPFFNGFISKWMIYIVCIAAGRPLLAFVAIFTSALTFAVFLRLLSSVFLGTKPETFNSVHEAPRSMVGPSIILAAGCILFGVVPQFAFIFLLYPATLAIFPSLSSFLPWGSIFIPSPFPLNLAIFGGLWDPFLLATIILVGLGIGYIIYRARGGFKEVPVTDKYLPFTGGALQDPYLKVDEARPTSTVFEHPLRPLLSRQRRLHTGLANMYVLWIVIFAIALLAILFVGTIWFGGWI